MSKIIQIDGFMPWETHATTYRFISHPFTEWCTKSTHTLLLPTPHLNQMQRHLLGATPSKSHGWSQPANAFQPHLCKSYDSHWVLSSCNRLWETEYMLQCCNHKWQTAAKWVRDCNKSTLLLRISDPLCRCTAIIAKSTWQDTAPTERIDEVNFSETYRFSWEGLQSLVKNMVEVPTVVIPKTAEILLPTCFKELMLKVLQ